ncbi:MAG: hypothetical protein WA485_25525 [Candidatus Sulfotelmatobacter sp.]
MFSFKVSLKGKKLCVAGIGKRGVLSAHVTWAASDRGEDLFLHVGGLANEEHIYWIDQKHVQVGDEIRVEICDAESVDDPIRKHRIDAAETLEEKKRYVRRIAKELGWKIQTDPDNPDDQHDNC